MARLICRQRGGRAALKLTKLFGIDDFPSAKDSGKVLIIIIYCYYYYYYYYYYYLYRIYSINSWSLLFLCGSIFYGISAQSRKCPTTGIRFDIVLIGYPRDFHLNYARFNGFLRNVSSCFRLQKPFNF